MLDVFDIRRSCEENNDHLGQPSRNLASIQKDDWGAYGSGHKFLSKLSRSGVPLSSYA
ncbi:uncharacterized protein LACBIDRAFT_308776 [Laccaria bicolor S238N-H82]|uniref:Predicted protein n=1 Tax=Laccaria bicolor (strain S238N-H82 / ATCC MYA-4686) TaxID=486041 RepID=B0CX62_LACBS|nr:uncharacterized protein LACBIDRAFT_308776 [Laccaria bicolor S238N-H82]EDR13618.1 predicted protein [Laccaria bicolor S238N-H82]|eukprot:XP_001876116.1 predicted protein [Laccaria bicolor S238N-H82]